MTPDLAELRRLYEEAMRIDSNEMAWDEWTGAISQAAEDLFDAAAERDALAAKVAECEALMVEPQSDPVLVGDSWIPVRDLAEVCGNYMRSSAEYAREAKALAIKVERVRALPAEHPAGGWYMTSMRDVLAALDEEPQP